MARYFEQFLGAETEFILARAKNPDVRPHEREGYICVYLAKVLSTNPEIELEIISRSANAK
jgi:hypothetical protein